MRGTGPVGFPFFLGAMGGWAGASAVGFDGGTGVDDASGGKGAGTGPERMGPGTGRAVPVVGGTGAAEGGAGAVPSFGSCVFGIGRGLTLCWGAGE